MTESASVPRCYCWHRCQWCHINNKLQCKALSTLATASRRRNRIRRRRL